MNVEHCSIKPFLWLSDLREQRGRAQRLHQRGEWKEERLRALRRSGDHLRQTFRGRERKSERSGGGNRHPGVGGSGDKWGSPPRQKVEFELVKSSTWFPLSAEEETRRERFAQMTNCFVFCRETGDHCVTGFYLNLSDMLFFF